MDRPTSALLIDAAIATAIGLTIGLEREHHDVADRPPGTPPPTESLMGVRTFALLALAGWVSTAITNGAGAATAWLPAAVLLAISTLLAAAVFKGGIEHGLTTEAAGLLTVLLGMLVPHDRELAVALGVATAVLLISKPWFRQLVPRLRRADLTVTLQLVVALAIVLPLLPNHAEDPWGALVPRRIGLFVTLILAVSWIGYVLGRLLDERRSAGLTGLVGGLVSSTAVTAAMAEKGRDPRMRTAGQLATCLASAVMSTRMIVIAAVVSPRLARAAGPAIGAMGLVMLLGAGWKWHTLRRERAADGDQLRPQVELQNPMSLLSALKWGAFMTAVLLAAALGQRYLGDRGLVATGAISGLADVDAITLAMSRGVATTAVNLPVAVLVITVAAGVNTLVKAGIALTTGGRRYGADIAKVFGAALVAGLAVAILGLL